MHEFHMAFKNFETRNSVVGPEGPVLLAESREAGQLFEAFQLNGLSWTGSELVVEPSTLKRRTRTNWTLGMPVW